MNNKVSLLNTKSQNKMIVAIEEMKQQLPLIIESGKLSAKIHKANYDAHINEGFTSEQALELCKSMEI